jgi:hypothetical protein
MALSMSFIMLNHTTFIANRSTPIPVTADYRHYCSLKPRCNACLNSHHMSQPVVSKLSAAFSLNHLHAPALLITPSNSSFSTPLPTPAPPFASRIMSLNKSSSTSSFNALATLFSVASVILPSPPLLKSLNASSTSCVCESDVRSRL